MVAPIDDRPQQLTPRQRDTLALLLAGHSEKGVAGALGISRHTVHVHVRQIYRHFDVHSRAELMARLMSPPASGS